MEEKLIQAVRSRDVQQIALLITRGANVNCRTAQGNSPLHLGVRVKDATIVRMLIAAGAEINAAGADGKTPLDWARALNFHEGALLLNQNGISRERDS